MNKKIIAFSLLLVVLTSTAYARICVNRVKLVMSITYRDVTLHQAGEIEARVRAALWDATDVNISTIAIENGVVIRRR